MAPMWRCIFATVVATSLLGVLVSGADAQIGAAPGGLAGPQGLGTLNPDEASGGRLIHPPTTPASSTGRAAHGEIR